MILQTQNKTSFHPRFFVTPSLNVKKTQLPQPRHNKCFCTWHLKEVHLQKAQSHPGPPWIGVTAWPMGGGGVTSEESMGGVTGGPLVWYKPWKPKKQVVINVTTCLKTTILRNQFQKKTHFVGDENYMYIFVLRAKTFPVARRMWGFSAGVWPWVGRTKASHPWPWCYHQSGQLLTSWKYNYPPGN